MNDFETKNYFNQLAEKWDQHPIEPDKDDQLLQILNRLQIQSNAHILDAGCGTGRLFHLIRAVIAKNTPFYAMDYAFLMTQQAKKKKAQPIYPICGDVQRLPIKDNQFNTILAFGLFPHIQEPKSALIEFRRILKKSGKLAIFHLKGSRSLNHFHQQLGGVVCDHFLPSLKEMHILFHEAGLKVDISEDLPDKFLCVGIKE
jgi:ubiquinone/menaquinone biosynthesis C-methylase UbiE